MQVLLVRPKPLFSSMRTCSVRVILTSIPNLSMVTKACMCLFLWRRLCQKLLFLGDYVICSFTMVSITFPIFIQRKERGSFSYESMELNLLVLILSYCFHPTLITSLILSNMVAVLQWRFYYSISFLFATVKSEIILIVISPNYGWRNKQQVSQRIDRYNFEIFRVCLVNVLPLLFLVSKNNSLFFRLKNLFDN